jgi:hypothetical protein
MKLSSRIAEPESAATILNLILPGKSEISLAVLKGSQIGGELSAVYKVYLEEVDCV